MAIKTLKTKSYSQASLLKAKRVELEKERNTNIINRERINLTKSETEGKECSKQFAAGIYYSVSSQKGKNVTF